MQCVKLRSVMGSYLNIHLNLFPIYVLLLLLTLSHGRPSAKVRETRDEPKSHRQQFRDKWYQSTNLYPSSGVNSVSNEYNSNSIVVYDSSQPAKNTQVSNIGHNQNFETVVETSQMLPKATGSHTDAISQHTTKVVDNDEMEKGMASSKASDFAVTNMNPNAAHGNPDADIVERDDEQPERNHSMPDSSKTPVTLLADEKHSYGEAYDYRLMSDQGAPFMRNFEELHATENAQPIDIVLEGGAGSNDPLGSQQLITFRQNILKSLGHSETSSQVNTSPTNVTLDYNDDVSLAKVWLSNSMFFILILPYAQRNNYLVFTTQVSYTYIFGVGKSKGCKDTGTFCALISTN